MDFFIHVIESTSYMCYIYLYILLLYIFVRYIYIYNTAVKNRHVQLNKIKLQNNVYDATLIMT